MIATDNQTSKPQNKNPDSTKKRFALWQQAFRPLFLLGSFFSALAIALFVGAMFGQIPLSPYFNLLFWHQHEMIFGFTGAIIVGFLLTAVQNWTGMRALNGWPLMLLVAVWCLARIALLLPAISVVAPFASVAFFVGALYAFTQLLLRADNKRNLKVAFLLLLFAMLDALSFFGVSQSNAEIISWASHGAIFLIVMLILVIGGRIIPLFTKNGLKMAEFQRFPKLEILAILSYLPLFIAFVFNFTWVIPAPILAAFCFVASGINFLKAMSWRPWLTLKNPMLWSLHLAHLFIPIGLLLLGLHYAVNTLSFSDALHALTAGAIGTMILAMITRVSLGHTGRTITANKLISLAFVSVFAAAIARVMAAFVPSDTWFATLLTSAILWIVAFSLFVFHFASTLFTSRPDGKVG